MKFIKKNKILIALLVIVLIFGVSLVIIVGSYLSSGNDEYGNRLNGIENYPITEEVINTVKTDISSLEKVESVKYNLEGRLANFIIIVEDDLSEDIARNYANKILEYFNSEIKGYYDFQIMIDSNIEESAVYPIIGTKHKKSDSLVWKQ